MTLVSAIMPTRGRVLWAHEAVECFRNQTYAEKELVILDDADEPSFEGDAFVYEDGVQYFRLTQRCTIARKRNDAVRLAAGSVILHWDSDDWSSPYRMADQLTRLERTSKRVTGYHSVLFYDEHSQRAYRYHGRPNVAVGSSLCYAKSFWQDHPFNERRTIEEDNEFVLTAAAAGELITVDGAGLIVARIHAGNTAAKPVDRPEYRPVEILEIPRGFPR